MTKQDFRIIRSAYKGKCKRLWRMYQVAHDRNGFYETDEAREAFNMFWAALEKFAKCVNVSPATASDILNLR